MSITWTRSEIRAKLRDLVAMPGTTGKSDSDLNDIINDFYQNHFPDDVHIQEMETFFEIDTASDDTGKYLLADYMRIIEEPMTIKDSGDKISRVTFYQNKYKFFELYPEDSHDETTERNRPKAALLYGRAVYLRPKANAVYTFKTAAGKKPAALSLDSSVPLDVRWGHAIAYGAAIMIEENKLNHDRVVELSDVYETLITRINRRDLIQKTTSQRAKPRF